MLSDAIRPGDGILWGQACAEPQTLVEALLAQRAALTGCSVFLGINYSGSVRPEHADHLRLSAYCGIGHNRALADAGVLDILPVPYSQLGGLIRDRRIRADVVMVQVSPPNARGEYSLGLAADYLVPAMEVCRAIVAEVNDQVPWTWSERLLKEDDFDLLVHTSRAPLQAPYRLGELEGAIAGAAAALVPNGATVEFGIGALPDAVCSALGGHMDLAIHSGTVGDGVVDLLRRGVARQVDAAMLVGTRKLYDFARDNPAIRLRSSEYTHSPRVLETLKRFVAINSAVEVDLTGQVNGEMARGSYVGAVGGAPDFIRAGNQSPGGLSIIVVPAARVVERLSGPVSVPRSDAGVVVTERGAADLRGCTLAERERRMRKISGNS
ncbi:MAG TPA: acetyl-CoA hydrolase/transferase C-terminal domain-containing protein [Burkholderiales bacterium]